MARGPVDPPHGPPADAPPTSERSTPPLDVRSSALDAKAWRAADRALYFVFVSAAVVYVAALFIGAMRHHTSGAWIAPFDETYVHFDFARSAARGALFQWSEGNGYAPSAVPYVWTLALGFRFGLIGNALLKWAIAIASVSLGGYAWSVSSAFAGVGPWAKFALPIAVLALGGADAVIFGGLEHAFLLGVFGALFGAARAIERTVERDSARPGSTARTSITRRAVFAWLGGGVGSILVATRTEAIVCAIGVAIFCGWRVARAHKSRAGVGVAVRMLVPSVLMLVGQGAFRKLVTGTWIEARFLGLSATAGAPTDALPLLQRMGCAGVRATELLSQSMAARVVLLGFAIVALSSVRVRRYAVLLLGLSAAWVIAVSLDPGLAPARGATLTSAMTELDVSLTPVIVWSMTVAALGFATAVSGFGETVRGRMIWGARVALAAIAVLVFRRAELTEFRDVEWWFGRACRNTKEQPFAIGAMIANADPPPKRIAVDEPGAITYAADRRGLDLSGRIGQGDLPFAEARSLGVGAFVEILEHVPVEQRPEVMVLFPSEWGDFPLLFGRYLNEVPIAGNVSRRGATAVLYRLDLRALDRAGNPRYLREIERIVDRVDIGDLMSERAHHYTSTRFGSVGYHVLTDLLAGADLFDAGRLVDVDQSETFEADLPIGGGRIAVRSASTSDVSIDVAIDGTAIGTIHVEKGDAWLEPWLTLPIGLPRHGRVTLTPTTGGWVDYHVWLIAPSSR